MKSIKYIYQLGLFLSLLVIGTSCRDEAKSPIPTWEPGMHGFGQFVLPNGSLIPLETNNNFVQQPAIDQQIFFRASNLAASSVRMSIKPISVDSKLEAEKIDLFVKMYEEYTDKDGNPKVALHGISNDVGLYIPQGQKFATLTGLANRTSGQATLTATQAYELLKNVTFDYGDGKGKVSVFGKRASRNFLPGDQLEVSWAITGKNGLLYNSWSGVYICSGGSATGGEVVGINCFLRWSVQ